MYLSKTLSSQPINPKAPVPTLPLSIIQMPSRCFLSHSLSLSLYLSFSLLCFTSIFHGTFSGKALFHRNKSIKKIKRNGRRWAKTISFRADTLITLTSQMVCGNLDLVYISCCVILKSTHRVTGLKYPFVQYNVHLLHDSCLEFMAKVQQEPADFCHHWRLFDKAAIVCVFMSVRTVCIYICVI